MHVRRMVWGLAAVFFLMGARAWGQLSVYAQATGASLQFQSSPHVYGGTWGLFYMMKPPAKAPILIGVDLRGSIMNRGGQGASIYGYGDPTNTAFDIGPQIGIRISTAPHALPWNLTPYVEGSFGEAFWRGGTIPLRQEAFHSYVQVVGGVDLPVYKRLSWRVAEATWGRAGATPGHINPITVSTGFVYQFPRAKRINH